MTASFTTMGMFAVFCSIVFMSMNYALHGIVTARDQYERGAALSSPRKADCPVTPQVTTLAMLKKLLQSGECTREASAARARCSSRWQGRSVQFERPSDTVVLVVSTSTGPARWTAAQPFCSVIITHGVLAANTDFDVPINRGNEASAYLKFIVSSFHHLPDTTIFMHDEVTSWHQKSDARDLLVNLNTEAYTWASLSSYYWFDSDPAHVKEYNRLGLSQLVPRHDNDGLMSFYCCAQFLVSKERITAYALPVYHNLYARLISLSADAYSEMNSWQAGEVYEFSWHGIFDPTNSWREPRLDPLLLCGNLTLCNSHYFKATQADDLIPAMDEKDREKVEMAPLAVQLVATDPGAGFFANVHFIVNQLNWLDQMHARWKKSLPILRTDSSKPVLRPFSCTWHACMHACVQKIMVFVF